MKTLHKLTPLFRLIFAALVLAAAMTLLYRGASGPSSAQQSQQSPQERQIEKLIAKHVPLHIKVTKEKEKAWKDLKNENWAHDFELEITNTGGRSIYFFYLLTYFDVPTDSGAALIAPIHYGRPEIGNLGMKANVDDVPIKPGESKVFRINPNILLSWDKGRREKGWRLPTKVRIRLQGLSFGDGTGLMLDEGVPYGKPGPEAFRETNPASPLPRKRDPVNWRAAIKRSIQTRESKTDLPAALLPVNYFETHSELTASSEVPIDDCDPACEHRVNNFRPRCYGCEPLNDPIKQPSGPCTSIDPGNVTCTIPETGYSYPCATSSADLYE